MRKVGDHAPGFELAAPSGARVSLEARIAEGPVLLFFFKLGCGATDIAAPFVEKIWDGYREHLSAEGSRLSVLGIGQEDVMGLHEFRQRHGLSFEVLADADLAVSRAYDLEATPTLVLLRGVEKLRADSSRVDRAEGFRIADVVEGWSKEATELLAEEIAARIGSLPVDLWAESGEVPASRPG